MTSGTGKLAKWPLGLRCSALTPVTVRLCCTCARVLFEFTAWRSDEFSGRPLNSLRRFFKRKTALWTDFLAWTALFMLELQYCLVMRYCTSSSFSVFSSLRRILFFSLAIFPYSWRFFQLETCTEIQTYISQKTFIQNVCK